MTPDEKEFFERLRRCKSAVEQKIVADAWAKKIEVEESVAQELRNRILYGEGIEPVPWNTETSGKEWFFKEAPIEPDSALDMANRFFPLIYSTTVGPNPLYDAAVVEQLRVEKVNQDINDLIESTKTRPE